MLRQPSFDTPLVPHGYSGLTVTQHATPNTHGSGACFFGSSQSQTSLRSCTISLPKLPSFSIGTHVGTGLRQRPLWSLKGYLEFTAAEETGPSFLYTV